MSERRDYVEMSAVALDAHDPDAAAEELYEQLSRSLMTHMDRELEGIPRDESHPGAFARILAHHIHMAVITSFQVGRSWQDAYVQHQREHDLTHEGGSNN